MRWKMGRRSENVEDRRGTRVPGGAKGVGIGVLVVAVIAVVLGGDPKELLGLLGQQGATAAAQGTQTQTGPRADDELADFATTVLGYTEDVWTELFSKAGKRYVAPSIVIFDDQVDTACGTQPSAVGPFYCPGDSKVYLDLVFFDELAKRHDAPGDFAQAYVIAHEIGHHIQNLLGISSDVHSQQRALGKEDANELSVRLELQADFLAGVWAHHANREYQILERGDVEEGLQAASSIGDDTLQRKATGRVSPESFTHGTSEQRVRWFRKGLERGELSEMDTFKARNL